MELKQLEYFLEVAKYQNITKAASSLFISQPSLSRIMKELEEELGTTLFVKSNRNTTLTEDGLILQLRAQEILDLVKKTENEFKMDQKEIIATIHIGAGETDLFKYVARAVKNVTEKYPNITFQFYSGVATDVLQRIKSGTLEFGFIHSPVNLTDLDAIYLEEEDEFGLIVRKDSVYAQKEFITKEDLLDMPLIMTRSNPDKSNDWLSDIYDQLNIVTSGGMPLNNIKLVEEGIGNYICIRKEELEDMTYVKFIPFEDSSIPRKWLLAWKKYAYLPKAYQIFIEEFKNVVSKE